MVRMYKEIKIYRGGELSSQSILTRSKLVTVMLLYIKITNLQSCTNPGESVSVVYLLASLVVGLHPVH